MENLEVVAVKEQIAQRLRSEIISGELAPNQKLTEEVLASRFGVSRGRIRDVLLELSKEGLLISRPNKGTTVNDVATPEVQALLIKLRLAIESYAVKCCASKPSDELIVQLKAALEDLSRHLKREDFAEVTQVDIAFHRAIVAFAGGDDLVNLWRPIIMRMRMNYQRITNPADLIAEHEALLTAIVRRDEKAAVEALKQNVR